MLQEILNEPGLAGIADVAIKREHQGLVPSESKIVHRNCSFNNALLKAPGKGGDDAHERALLVEEARDIGLSAFEPALFTEQSQLVLGLASFKLFASSLFSILNLFEVPQSCSFLLSLGLLLSLCFLQHILVPLGLAFFALPFFSLPSLALLVLLLQLLHQLLFLLSFLLLGSRDHGLLLLETLFKLYGARLLLCLLFCISSTNCFGFPSLDDLALLLALLLKALPVGCVIFGGL